MLIGIDGNEANIENRVGVNTYAYQILHGLYTLNNKSEKPHKFIVYLQHSPLYDMPKENANWEYKVLPGKAMWILTRLMPYLLFATPKPDVLFTPSHYVPPITTMPKVMAIMDLGYLENKAQFTKLTFWQLKYWTAISVNVSNRIIAISNTTKKDIINHYPSNRNKIDVTYLAHDETFDQPSSPKEIAKVRLKYKIAGDYILYIGTLKPSKNVDGLIQSFKSVLEGHKVELVIAGKKGWLYEEIFAMAKKLKIEDKIIFTGFFPESDKKSLMAGAKVLVSPSYWEGFGIHVLESMALGVPVVISNTGSLSEVGGLAAVYVDPYTIDDIAKGLKKVLSMNKIEYNKLTLACKKQAAKFSWSKTSEKTMKILEVAGKNHV